MFTPVCRGLGGNSGGTKAADQIQQSASVFTHSGVSVVSGEDPSRALRTHFVFHLRMVCRTQHYLNLLHFAIFPVLCSEVLLCPCSQAFCFLNDLLT